VLLLPTAEGCPIGKTLIHLASRGAEVVVMPEGLPCEHAPPAAAQAPPTEQRPAAPMHPPPKRTPQAYKEHMHTADSSWWPPTWPTPRSSWICVAAPPSTEPKLHESDVARHLPVYTLPHTAAIVAYRALEDADVSADAGWEATASARSLDHTDDALGLLPANLAGISLDVASGGAHGVRLLGPEPQPEPGDGSAGGKRRWQLVLRALGEGTLSAEASEGEGVGQWSAPTTLVSHRQEAYGQLAACHRPDHLQGSRCSKDAECGVSGETCSQRRCSAYGYCFSPAQRLTGH